MMGAKYKYPSIPDKPIPGDPAQSSGLADTTDDDRNKIIEERNKFLDSVEPLLRDDEAGLDALLDYYRDEGDESFSRVESVADILKKQADSKAPQIVGVVPPESKNIVGIEPLPGTEPKVTEPPITEEPITEEPITEEPITVPTAIPTLTANQEAIEGINKVDPAKILDNIFGKEGEIKSARENLLKEMDKAEAAKYNIEPLKDASRKDNKVVAQEKRKVASYLTKNLEGDLEKLNILKTRTKDYIGKDNPTFKFNLRKDSKEIKEIENRIKNTIGKYINPISGDISIADKGYKDSVIKRLNKKFGKDLYPLLASFSSVQRIN